MGNLASNIGNLIQVRGLMKIIRTFIITIFFVISASSYCSEKFKLEQEKLTFNKNQVIVTYYKESDSTTLVFKENIANGAVIGEICYIKIKTDPNWFYICNVYIEPTHRGQGYAQCMLKHVINLLKQQKSNAIFLEVGPFEKIYGQYIELPTNDPNYFLKIKLLKKLYSKCGFKEERNEQVIKCLESIYKSLFNVKMDKQNVMTLCLEQKQETTEDQEDLFDPVCLVLAFAGFFN